MVKSQRTKVKGKTTLDFRPSTFDNKKYEDNISDRQCWIYRFELGATLVERSSSLLTLGRVEASFALLSLKRSL